MGTYPNVWILGGYQSDFSRNSYSSWRSTGRRVYWSHCGGAPSMRRPTNYPQFTDE